MSYAPHSLSLALSCVVVIDVTSKKTQIVMFFWLVYFSSLDH
jgi:hypothetical protein